MIIAVTIAAMVVLCLLALVMVGLSDERHPITASSRQPRAPEPSPPAITLARYRRELADRDRQLAERDRQIAEQATTIDELLQRRPAGDESIEEVTR